MVSHKINIKRFEELSSKELYNILKARQDIFIVEQDISYPDLDGKDVSSQHFWVQGENSHDILSYLRLVIDETMRELSIGRVLTASSHRGQGLSRILVSRAIEVANEAYSRWTLALHAQEYLVEFYKSLGFRETGPVFYYPNEDPVPHVPMMYGA